MKTTKLTASFNSFEICMTLSQAESASHQGECQHDVQALLRDVDISEQFDDISADDIRKELSEHGAWDDEQLADDSANRERILWIAAGNIMEEWKALDPQVRALAMHLDCNPAEISEEKYKCYDMPTFSAEGGEYAVATDEEADAAWDQSLDSYIEECINPEIDKLEVGNLSAYIKFDEEKWKRDARMDGRGHSLASYDGGEDEETIDGETYFIFRIN